MVWPATPLPVEVGLFVNGAWVDATATGNGVRERSEIKIDHGRSSWARIADPSRASFTLDNRDGRWSPDNPTGPYYGHLRRNIPCRIGVGRGEVHLRPTSVAGESATTPNHASLDILGDIDLRVELELESDPVDVQAGGLYTRVARRASGADGWEWEIYNSAGNIRSKFIWRDAAAVQHTCHTGETGVELPPDFNHEHRALRVTLDVNNGASGYTVTWYTSTTLAGTWTQLGSPVVVAGTTSIKTTTAQLQVGANPTDVIHRPLPGKIYGFELRSSIGGTVVANPAFNTRTAGATTWTDSAGRVWTIGPAGRISGVLWRFHGELSSIPTRWNTNGSDVWAPVEATGLFRRLRQGNRRLDSALRRGLLAQANSAFGSNLVGYWPLEDTGQGLTLFGAAVGGGPMLITGGTPTTGSFKGFSASAPLPVVNDAVLTATVDTYSPATAWQVRWLQNIPAGTTSGGVYLDVIRITTTSLTWVVQWQDTSGGNMRILAYNSGGTLVYTGGAVGMNATGKAFRVSLAVTANGANVDYDFQAQVAGGTPGGVVTTNAVAGAPGQVTEIKINEDSNLDTWAFGHVTLQNAKTATTELLNELNAYNGERAATRIQRLCREEGIATRLEGSSADTEAMGPQQPGTLMDLLQECALTDLGVLYESRESVAVAYRTRSSMVGQPVIIALDYTGGDVGRSPELDRDDAHFANDISVENWTGATGRAVLDDGSPASISEPPVGAGRYQTSYRVNTYADARAAEIATGILTISSVDEPRVSALQVALQHPALVADIALTSAVFDSTLGDLVEVTNNLPAALGTTAIRQLVQGVRERMSAFEHELDLVTSPASPWDTDPVTPGATESLFYAWENRPAYVEPDPSAAAGTPGKILADSLGLLRRVSVSTKTAFNTAKSAALPGDQIYITANLVGAGNDRVIDWPVGDPSGTATNPIMITCAPGVWIDGGETVEDLNSRGLYIVENDHIWLYGCNVRNANFLCMYNKCNGTASKPIRVWYCYFQNSGHSMLNIAGNFGLGGSSSYFDVRYNTFDYSGVFNQEFGEAVYIGYGSTNSPTLQTNNNITVEANHFINLTAEAVDIKAGSQYVFVRYNLIENCNDHATPTRSGSAANVGFPGAVQFPGHTTPPAGWAANIEVIGNRWKNITSASTKFPDGLVLTAGRGTKIVGNLFSLVDVGSAGLIVFYLDGNVPTAPGDTGTVEAHNNTCRDAGASMNALYRVTNAGASQPALLATMNANSNHSNNVRANSAGAATGADYTVADTAFTDDGTGYPGSFSAPVDGGPLDVAGADTTAHWATDYAGNPVTVPVKPGAYQ